VTRGWTARVLPAHLAVAGAAAGLAFANAARLGTGVAVAALGALAATGVVGGSRRAVLAAAVLAILVGGWVWGSHRLVALDRSPLSSDVDRSGDALVEVTGPARHGLFAIRIPGRIRSFERAAVDERVELELPPGRAPPQGAYVDALVVIRAPKGPSNGFDERTWLRWQGIHVVLHVDRWRIVGRRGGLGGLADRLRRWLERASAPGLRGERRAVVEGVLLGDDDALSPSLKNAFRRSGLYHLLAVSGENVVLLAGGVLVFGWLLGVARWAGHVGALAAIVAYVLAVGPQPSVVRAAVSGAAVSIAWLAARERDRWHVLGLGAVVLLAWNPYVVHDAGFQLSFVAVLAIFVLAGPLGRWLEGYPLPAKLRAGVAISAACALVTAPILWLQFGQVPLLGVVANAAAEPAMPILLGLSFGAALADPVLPQLGAVLAWLNGWVAVYVASCARVVGAVPFAQATGETAGVVVAALVVGAIVVCRRLLRPLGSAPGRALFGRPRS
jgi:competence protein ComEC